MARQHACLVVFRHSVGDFVPVGAAILEVHGATLPTAAGEHLSTMLALGAERTIEQDPAFAIRVMVDIAIRALSPAVNDPTTAVQVLDHLGETLRLVGATDAAVRGCRPGTLTSGVIMPVRTWPDFLALGITEIREYGATSIQVMRRLRALLEELGELVLPENRAAVDEELRHLDATVVASYAERPSISAAARSPGPPGDRRAGRDAHERGLPWADLTDHRRAHPPTVATRPARPMPVLEEAGRQLRAPWAASIAGLLFSVLFTAALVLVRSQVEQGTTAGQNTAMVIGGLYLAPFAGIMFLWFVAVIRDQIGEREDRFFATVFFGSGLLFVGLLFTTAAVVSTPTTLVQFLGAEPLSAESMSLLRGLGYTLLFALATRAAAVFMLATATIGIKSGVFPRWFALIGALLGLVLLVAVSFYDWLILVLPGWVALVSLFILRRERARR